MKRRILDMMMAACCMAVSFLGLAACDNELDIQQEYPFTVESMPVADEIAGDETVEIRFYLDREGNYGKAEYDIGYIQVEGKGEVTDCEGVKLVNREVRPLAEMPGLDTDNPVKQVFTLFYRSTSTRRSELKFFVRDNFGQEREMSVSFDIESDAAKE